MNSVIEDSMDDGMSDKGDDKNKIIHKSFLSNTVNRKTETHTITTNLIES